MPILSSLKLEKDVSRLSFSVIIPVFNNWDEAEVAISSCLAQTYSQYEIIVVDDASFNTPQTVFERASAAGFKVIRNPVNVGPFFSRINGVREASGDYIIFLDADDSLANTFMSSLDTFLAHQSMDVVATKVAYRTWESFSDLKAIKPFKCQLELSVTNSFSEWIDNAGIKRLGTPGKVYNRELLIEVMELHAPVFASAQLRYAEDVYLFFLCCLHATTYGYTSDSFYRYSPGEHSVTLSRGPEKQRIKQALVKEVSILMKTSAILSPHSGETVSDFFQSQLSVDYHLLDRWNSRSRWDGIYTRALWRAYKARGNFRDFLRFLVGTSLYLVLGIQL